MAIACSVLGHAFLQLTGGCQRVGQVAPRDRGVRVGRDRGPKRGHRVLRPVLRGERDAEIVADASGVGDRSERDREVLGRFLRAVPFEQRVGEVVVRVGIVALQRERLAIGVDRLVDAARCALHHAEVVVRRCVVGLKRDRPLVVHRRVVGAPVSLKRHREIGLGDRHHQRLRQHGPVRQDCDTGDSRKQHAFRERTRPCASTPGSVAAPPAANSSSSGTSGRR